LGKKSWVFFKKYVGIKLERLFVGLGTNAKTLLYGADNDEYFAMLFGSKDCLEETEIGAESSRKS